MSLPGILARIAELIGEGAALRLAQAAGGTTMKFSPRPNSSLARIVGADAAKIIHAEFGVQKYTIPMAHVRGQRGRRAEAAKMLARGVKVTQVALACDVHERTAWRVRRKLAGDDEDGLPLFPKD